ncbi:MAG TPA: PmoA family protein [Opitutus sp.]|nr:PmoA family protein [Opitutus sp.]
MNICSLPLRLLALLTLSLSSGYAASADATVKLTRLDDRVRVEMGGALFTEYIFNGGPRPFLHPILAADGTQLTRSFPMETVAGEETDHPHHRSLWFTHGAVNGVDFWTEGPTKGTIVNESVEQRTDENIGTIRSRNRWLGPDGKLVCTDETLIRFLAHPEGRFLDYEVTIRALDDQPLLLGDTKEGSMAIRIAQWMTMTHKYQKREVEGQGRAVNDSGIRDAAAWGKRAAWVDYHAPYKGQTYGVAIFDHPANPRHPTWWHVRDYGLFAANPFGQHDFEGTKEKPLPKDLGDLTVPAGGKITFRYRFYFHLGDEKTARVADMFKAYVAGEQR